MARGKNPVVDHGIDWIIDEDDNILGYRPDFAVYN